MKKKVVAAVVTLAMMTVAATGCSKQSEEKTADGKESYTIGIEQFAEHGSLDNCREGFLKGLESEGITEGENLTVQYKNAAADMGTAGQISDSFVSDQVDMICAIATPAAQSAYNAAMDSKLLRIRKHLTHHLKLSFNRKLIGSTCNLPCRRPFFIRKLCRHRICHCCVDNRNLRIHCCVISTLCCRSCNRTDHIYLI